VSETDPKSSCVDHPGVVWLVAGAYFMEFLDATVITTALPEMARSFGAQTVEMSTGMSAYMLAMAVFIPLSGWMSERFGPRRVFGGAVFVFTLASALCSLSSGLWLFTGARILQGIGGAMMVPVGRVAVLRGTPKDGLIRAIAMLTWPALTAPVLGPPLGGFITEHWGWQWIFWINVPLGVIGFILALRWIGASQGEARPFDWPGFLLSGIGCSALMLACDLASHTPFVLSEVAGLGGFGLVATVWAVRHLRRTPHPLVDLRALSIQTFAVAMWGGSVFRIAINSAPFLLPLLFQLVFGFSPSMSGMLLLALFAGNLCMKPGTTWVMQRWGFRRVLIVNGWLVVLGFVGCALLVPGTPKAVILAVLFFGGLCRSMQFTCLNTLSFCDIAKDRMNGASTLSSIFFQMGIALGVALGAAALQASNLLNEGGAGLGLFNFQVTFLAMALFSALAILDFIRLPEDAGAHVSGAKTGR